MAAVTVNRVRRNVMGNRRVLTANIDIATSGDTWETGLKIIESVNFLPDAAAAVGATVSGGTITFLTGAAEEDAHVTVTGL